MVVYTYTSIGPILALSQTLSEVNGFSLIVTFHFVCLFSAWKRLLPFDW